MKSNTKAEIFLMFVEEAMDYFRIPTSSIRLLVNDDWYSAAVNYMDSDENEIVLALGLDLPVDTRGLLRIAWHEIAHWKDGLDGWPIFVYKRPRCKKLNYVLIDKVFEDRVWHDLFPDILTKKDSLSMFLGIGNVISDVAVCRRIMNSPANMDTIIAITKLLDHPFLLADYTFEELYRRTIAIAMEMEYVRTSIERSKIHTRRLEEVELEQLRKIFEKIPELRSTFEEFQKLFSEIKFTGNADELYQWRVKASKLIPPRIIPSLVQLFLATYDLP